MLLPILISNFSCEITKLPLQRTVRLGAQMHKWRQGLKKLRPVKHTKEHNKKHSIRHRKIPKISPGAYIFQRPF